MLRTDLQLCHLSGQSVDNVESYRIMSMGELNDLAWGILIRHVLPVLGKMQKSSVPFFLQ